MKNHLFILLILFTSNMIFAAEVAIGKLDTDDSYLEKLVDKIASEFYSHISQSSHNVFDAKRDDSSSECEDPYEDESSLSNSEESKVEEEIIYIAQQSTQESSNRADTPIYDYYDCSSTFNKSEWDCKYDRRVKIGKDIYHNKLKYERKLTHQIRVNLAKEAEDKNSIKDESNEFYIYSSVSDYTECISNNNYLLKHTTKICDPRNYQDAIKYNSLKKINKKLKLDKKNSSYIEMTYWIIIHVSMHPAYFKCEKKDF